MLSHVKTRIKFLEALTPVKYLVGKIQDTEMLVDLENLGTR